MNRCPAARVADCRRRGCSIFSLVNVVGDALQVVGFAFDFGQGRQSLTVRRRSELARFFETVKADICHFSVPLVTSLRLAEGFVTAGHVEDVVDYLEKDSQF